MKASKILPPFLIGRRYKTSPRKYRSCIFLVATTVPKLCWWRAIVTLRYTALRSHFRLRRKTFVMHSSLFYAKNLNERGPSKKSCETLTTLLAWLEAGLLSPIRTVLDFLGHGDARIMCIPIGLLALAPWHAGHAASELCLFRAGHPALYA